jgi:hypothetical protein
MFHHTGGINTIICEKQPQPPLPRTRNFSPLQDDHLERRRENDEVTKKCRLSVRLRDEAAAYIRYRCSSIGNDVLSTGPQTISENLSTTATPRRIDANKPLNPTSFVVGLMGASQKVVGHSLFPLLLPPILKHV